MGMSTGARVAIGCAILATLGVVVVVAVIGLGAFWAKGKVEKMAGDLEGMTEKSEEIDRWREEANARPYTPPANGVIPEDRLVKFLEVRKDVYDVYEEHRAEIERLAERAEKNEVSLSETLSGMGRLAGLTTDIRLAQVKGLAEVGMNEDEYRTIQVAVYKSAWASNVEKEKGRLPAEAVREQAEAMPQQAREAIQASGAASGAEVMPAETMERAVDETAEAMKRAASAVEVPRENVELFRQYEDEIEKYAMSGLAIIGL